MKPTRLIAVPLLVLALLGCADDGGLPRASRFDSSVASRWIDQVYASIRVEGLAPTAASRIYAYTGIAFYEAIVPGSGRLRSLAGQVNGLPSVPQPDAHTGYDWPTVANASIWEAARSFFATASAATREGLDDLHAQIDGERSSAVGSDAVSRSTDLGRRIGEAIVAWAETDGYSAFHNCAYVQPVGPSLWVPTPPLFRPALEPCWGSLRPFALTSAAACLPAPPPSYSEAEGSEFYAAAKEVHDTVVNLTEEQREIAVFWADNPGQTGTPPGHWISLVGQLAASRPLNLEEAAEAYARVGLAVGDAFISCWHAKYLYNLLRPVTYINRFIDPAWVTIIGTPPFPTYTSGHSTSSGAATFMLTDMLGEFAFTDHTHDERGLPARSFPSFTAAAEETADSRRYAGIHYEFDNQVGLTQGQCVGQNIKTRIQFHR